MRNLIEGENWTSVQVSSKWAGPVRYEVQFPLYLVVAPSLDNTLLVAMDGVTKFNETGLCLWDTRVANGHVIETPQDRLGLVHMLCN